MDDLTIRGDVWFGTADTLGVDTVFIVGGQNDPTTASVNGEARIVTGVACPV